MPRHGRGNGQHNGVSKQTSCRHFHSRSLVRAALHKEVRGGKANGCSHSRLQKWPSAGLHCCETCHRGSPCLSRVFAHNRAAALPQRAQTLEETLTALVKPLYPPVFESKDDAGVLNEHKYGTLGYFLSSAYCTLDTQGVPQSLLEAHGHRWPLTPPTAARGASTAEGMGAGGGEALGGAPPQSKKRSRAASSTYSRSPVLESLKCFSSHRSLCSSGSGYFYGGSCAFPFL